MNAELTIRDSQGEQKLLIESPESLGNILSSEFDINLEPSVVEHLFIRFVAPVLAENKVGITS